MNVVRIVAGESGRVCLEIDVVLMVSDERSGCDKLIQLFAGQHNALMDRT